MKRFLFCLSMVSLVLLSGCGREKRQPLSERLAEKIVEAQTGGQAKLKLGEESVSIRTDEGEMRLQTGGGLKLPADFPKDVFTYPGAQLESSMQVPGGKMLQWRSKEAHAMVGEAFARGMQAEGWSQIAAIATGEQTIFGFEKDGRNTTLTANADDQQTLIVMVLTDPPAANADENQE